MPWSALTQEQERLCHLTWLFICPQMSIGDCWIILATASACSLPAAALPVHGCLGWCRGGSGLSALGLPSCCSTREANGEKLLWCNRKQCDFSEH